MKREEYDDEHEIVEDGGSVRVPLYMMDAEQRAVLGAAVVDALGRPAGYRPGGCYLARPNVDARVAAAMARDGYLRRLRDAWRGPAVRQVETGRGAGDIRAQDAGRAAYNEWLRNAWRGAR